MVARRAAADARAGVVPVLVGVAARVTSSAWRLVAALVVAAGLQIGVNFANDYFDGVRGVDTRSGWDRRG